MSTEPTEMYDRGEQEDAEKPDVDNPFDAHPRSEVVPLETLRRNDLERGGGKGGQPGGADLGRAARPTRLLRDHRSVSACRRGERSRRSDRRSAKGRAR